MFLTEQNKRGSAYSTLNSHRSALSLLLGDVIGTDAQIKRLLKGSYRLKPSVPKYVNTWDPKIVLNYVSIWYPNRNLSLEKITKKLIVLLALCTGHRVQTLSLIDVNNIVIAESGIRIAIHNLIKTSAPGREQPILFLPYFDENKSICPATTLQDYLYMTRELRPTDAKFLMLTIKKPHKVATTQSLSRWIKQTLAESGVDVSIFSAHSTRHASTSAAKAAGVSLDIIRRTAGWTKASEAFAKFYNRPISNEGEFARSVFLENT